METICSASGIPFLAFSFAASFGFFGSFISVAVPPTVSDDPRTVPACCQGVSCAAHAASPPYLLDCFFGSIFSITDEQILAAIASQPRFDSFPFDHLQSFASHIVKPLLWWRIVVSSQRHRKSWPKHKYKKEQELLFGLPIVKYEKIKRSWRSAPLCISCKYVIIFSPKLFCSVINWTEI